MIRTWLNFLNLSDDYERRARFLPASLSLLPLLPLGILFGLPVFAWFNALLAGTGIAAVLAVGLSHLASAFGNRFQEHLWPHWPHDAPTNQWLNPKNTLRSTQQKKIWYTAIKRLTNLDVEAAVTGSGVSIEYEAVINDAVAQLRNCLWQSEYAERLRIHNREYGFARNLTGSRPVWLSFSVFSSVVICCDYYFTGGQIFWPVISIIATVIVFFLAYAVLPEYVRKKAHYYAETFLATVLELDRRDSN